MKSLYGGIGVLFGDRAFICAARSLSKLLFSNLSKSDAMSNYDGVDDLGARRAHGNGGVNHRRTFLWCRSGVGLVVNGLTNDADCAPRAAPSS